MLAAAAAPFPSAVPTLVAGPRGYDRPKRCRSSASTGRWACAPSLLGVAGTRRERNRRDQRCEVEAGHPIAGAEREEARFPAWDGEARIRGLERACLGAYQERCGGYDVGVLVVRIGGIRYSLMRTREVGCDALGGLPGYNTRLRELGMHREVPLVSWAGCSGYSLRRCREMLDIQGSLLAAEGLIPSPKELLVVDLELLELSRGKLVGSTTGG